MNTPGHHSIKILQNALVLVCAVLAIILLIELNRNYSIINAPANVDSANQTPAIQDVEQSDSIVAITNYEDIINRPLFNDDRKPYVYIGPATEEKSVKIKERPMPTAPLQQLTLTAVVITPEKSLAILQIGNTKTLQSVKLGETIDGWTLTEIQNQSVVLEQGGNTQLIELEVKGSSKTSKPPLTQKLPEIPPKNTVKIKARENMNTTNNTETAVELKTAE